MSGVRIGIENPCNESWQGMQPVQHGRFCNACSKTVVDFSSMTDQQILDFLSHSKGGICARIRESQSGRELQPMPVPPKAKWWLMCTMPLMLWWNRATAQMPAKRTDSTTQKQPLKENDNLPPVVVMAYPPKGGHTTFIPGIGGGTIKGIVRNNLGEPVQYAFITTADSCATDFTNADGAFTLHLYSIADSVTLMASAGAAAVTQTIHPQLYTSVTLVLQNKLPVIKNVTVEEQLQGKLEEIDYMGVVVYSKKPSLWHRIFHGKRKRR
ncbi:hypothetical protein SAMN05421788_110269 [Filimonas lacunae]|uniref:Carboxypeptidase regulatory-like domain-containing protein n=1 Tax=Filimonas lacunae TaxID=477680 RepID=A0A173MAK5_9BACT|nr:hypothetical protein [Filimonas lacunae]BAV04539.1 hypothetical protein FLA_0531 [Filimonas lacunae]SIT31738.1 hypothetical protein SAMN05421788_110269 [Filimonas lacunae]